MTIDKAERLHEMKHHETVSIMDIQFINMTKKDFLHHQLYPRLNRQQKCFVVTANPEIVMQGRAQRSYKEVLQSADFVTPDGAGILLAAKYLKQPLQERIAGYDLMLDLLNFAHVQGLRCYFLGGKDYVNEKMVLEVEKQFPNINIVGHQHGYTDINDPMLIDDMRKAAPDLVFVALGMPRQEQWIAHHIDAFQKGLFIGVGGSFDTFVGEVKRAPQKWINLNLEWLYRIIKQPFRIKRIGKAFEFIFRILLKKS
ncbi:WecB/TagA/CpsF family glycosyltransferase [Virgibacillus sp. LDC-1]|uniref:WecB/TagA/CpsF family glycosyltransferase n=1 Tax=Virgibacillus sp. LDC-1 TaxID=3039856 RepID=UPI0024DF0503|nr:WecB/TagA/CpsF family glycosyltransferase [Virgibacillus sp. LDC-1]